MFGLEAAALSGAAHLQYFKGTDTIPALFLNNDFYGIQPSISSVPATEHSVMSAGGEENELETFRRLIEDVYPSGIVSIVSDTWNLWDVISRILPALKSSILARDGKVVIRPDSGNPITILCGREDVMGDTEHQRKGLIECLWDIFGGTINSKGYKQLDGHIGAIYGDSITLVRAQNILERLEKKGFSSTNIVFGIGSFTYQYNTRDTLGWAVKATYAQINGEGHAITKNPVTDDGTKKSHSGLLKVVKVNGAHGYSYECLQNQAWDEFHADDNELKLVFKDGKIY
jgi:nicotinamide phosphoribosyltransferase